MDTALLSGVRVHPLEPHLDDRGSLTELYRGEWNLGEPPVQWNLMSSRAGVLRGVHVHHEHSDYVAVPQDEALIGLCDLRRTSPTFRQGTLLSLGAHLPALLTIPTGVAHGFYFPKGGIVAYGTSHYWDPADELGCHWTDPGLGIPWPVSTAITSDRDSNAGSLEALLRELEPYQPF